ncbi:MAG: hypothetical protein Q9209_001718 [Squamulea sp. 1 TL-2023]
MNKAQYMLSQGLMASAKDDAVNAHVERQERKASLSGGRIQESTDEDGPKPGNVGDIVPAGGIPAPKAKDSGNDRLSGPSIPIKNPMHRANEGKKVTEKLSNPDVLDLAVDGEKQKDKKQKAKTEDSNAQQSSLHYNNLVQPEGGLAIKGAATRRQWAIDRVSSKKEASTKGDEKRAALDSSNGKSDRPVQEDSKAEDKEISGEISKVDTPSIDNNDKGLASEIAAVAERFTSTRITPNHQHTPNTSPTIDHYAHTVDCPLSEKQEQSHIVRLPGSNMPLLQIPGEQGRKSRPTAQRRNMSKSPQLPGWLAQIQASNPAKPLPYVGIHMPNSIQPSILAAYYQGKEMGIVCWPVATLNADISPATERTETWVQDSGWPLPKETATLDAYDVIDFSSHKNKQSGNVNDSIPHRSLDVTGKHRMALRDQSTNFPPLPSPTKHRNQEGHSTVLKDQPQWKGVHLRVPESNNAAALPRHNNWIPLTSPVAGQRSGNGPVGQAEAPTPSPRVPVDHDNADSKKLLLWTAPHMRMPSKITEVSSKTEPEATPLRQQPQAELRTAENERRLKTVEAHLGMPVSDAHSGQRKPTLTHIREETNGGVQSTGSIYEHHHDQPPRQVSSSVASAQLLMTNSSDFLSKAAVTLSSWKQTSPNQTQSPMSTNLNREAAGQVNKMTSPSVQLESSNATSPPRPVDTVAPRDPTKAPFAMRRNNVQQEHVQEDPNVHYENAIRISAGSIRGSTESIISNESVCGQGDENRLSSIPESIFFAHAYNGRDASVASEIVFEGRKPKNPYKGPRVAPAPTPGWEGAEAPGYEPGQLVGWDGNWQEAPVEWDRRDLYDYTTADHQQNVKNFIDDRFEQFLKGFCPPLDVESDALFMSGRALATGLDYFGKPQDQKEHHCMPPEDPFSQGKLTKTAAMSIENYLRVHGKRLQEREQREAAAADRKKVAKAQRAAEQQVREQAIAEAAANRPPNPYTPRVNIYIRPAKAKDLPQVCDIHNYYIRDATVTGERVELTEHEWRTRYNCCEEDKFPFLVAILVRHNKMDRRHGRNERVVGFTYAEDFAGEQTMWGHTCELQLFVDRHFLHQGIGKNLMDCILRGINPSYQAKHAVEFEFTTGHNDRYEGGGERIITNVVFPLPYVAEEDEHAQWVGQWLFQEFGFELQGLLVGVGRVHNGSMR